MCVSLCIYIYMCICIYNPITHSFPMVFKALWCSKCEASQGYDASGIQPVVKNNQNIYFLIQNIWLWLTMPTGCSKCEASAGHGVIQYKTGCSKCEIWWCSKCEVRSRHRSRFFFPNYVLSVCSSLYIYKHLSLSLSSMGFFPASQVWLPYLW